MTCRVKQAEKRDHWARALVPGVQSEDVVAAKLASDGGNSVFRSKPGDFLQLSLGSGKTTLTFRPFSHQEAQGASSLVGTNGIFFSELTTRWQQTPVDTRKSLPSGWAVGLGHPIGSGQIQRKEIYLHSQKSHTGQRRK